MRDKTNSFDLTGAHYDALSDAQRRQRVPSHCATLAMRQLCGAGYVIIEDGYFDLTSEGVELLGRLDLDFKASR